MRRLLRRAGIAALGALLAIGAPDVPRVAAQPKVPRIGVLAFGAAEPFQSPFRDGLRELGYVEGQNLLIEWRAAGGRDDRLAEFATELVRLKVDGREARNDEDPDRQFFG